MSSSQPIVLPLFFLLKRPPPGSTLFPYTTLFRSSVPLCARPRRRRSACRAATGRTPGTPDRKSTRLNSSHLGISYAVFCLKKKITNTSSHPFLSIGFPCIHPNHENVLNADSAAVV